MEVYPQISLWNARTLSPDRRPGRERENLFGLPEYEAKGSELKKQMETWFLKYADPAIDGVREGVTGSGTALQTRPLRCTHRCIWPGGDVKASAAPHENGGREKSWQYNRISYLSLWTIWAGGIWPVPAVPFMRRLTLTGFAGRGMVVCQFLRVLPGLLRREPAV